jgi:hypothetical protein
MFRVLLVAGAALLAVGCKRAPDDGVKPANAIAAPEGFVSWHAGGKLCFPERSGRWVFERTTDYRAQDGEDRSFHYTLPNAVGTMYVYPQRNAATADRTAMQRELAIVASLVPDVDWHTTADVAHPRWEGEGHIVIGRQEIELPNSNRSRKSQTLAMVHSHGPWVVKVRLTWFDNADGLALFGELIGQSAIPCDAPNALAPSGAP